MGEGFRKAFSGLCEKDGIREENERVLFFFLSLPPASGYWLCAWKSDGYSMFRVRGRGMKMGEFWISIFFFFGAPV